MKSRIDARRWSEIQIAFDEVVDLTSDVQSERLSQLGMTDPDLRETVAQLLAGDVEAPKRLAHIDSVLMPSDRMQERPADVDRLKLTGRTVSQFNILEPLAAGGMGVVYRAVDTRLRRTIALKFALPTHHFDRDTKERFLHEARSAGALDHPNICSIYETGETDDGHLFLAMPLYDGETLKTRIARDGPLEISDAISIAKQIAAGLRAAHKAGIVHRDVKPANVMLLHDGNVKILDFGLAKVRDLTLTVSTARVGTVSYMAPEQIQGQPVDGRTDLWALGVTLYEIITGRRPFEGEYDVSVAHAIVSREPPLPSVLRSGVPPEVDQIIWRLLRKDPDERYDSAEDVFRISATPLTSSASLHLPQPRRFGVDRLHISARAAFIALPVVAVIMSGAWLLRSANSSVLAAPLTIAVLPFQDLTNTPGSRYLADGLSDAIATDLSRLRPVAVSTSPLKASKSGTGPLSQIAFDLSAVPVVKGTVQRLGNRIRVEAQLVDAKNNKQLWANRYEGPLTALLGIRHDATKAILKTLKIDLTDGERALLERPPTTSAAAYDLYLRGREVELNGPGINKKTTLPESIGDAQSLYSRARDVDPGFALARARLSMTQMYSALQYDPSPSRLEQARLEAETALRLQPGLPEGHAAMALYWGAGRGEKEKAIEQNKLALEGSPNNSTYHLNLGIRYNRLGLWEEAVAENERAMQLDPFSADAAWETALINNRLRRYDRAGKTWDRAIALAPDKHEGKLIKGYMYIRWQGTVDTLVAAVKHLPAGWDDQGSATWARFVVARIRRRNRDALAALNASSQKIIFDDFSYRPVVLLRGLTLETLGDGAGARRNYEAALMMLVDSVRVHPDDPRMRIALGLAYAGLHRKEDAVREARRAMELAPLAQNNTRATAFMGGAAEIFAQVGDTDSTLKLLELLLAMPAGREASVALLRVDPTFDLLRRDPRFELLLQRFSPN